MREVRQRAGQRMKRYCRACPVFGARARAGEVPGAGGRIGTGSGFTAMAAAVGGLADGAAALIEQVRAERIQTMILPHAADVGSVEKEILR